MVITNEDKVWRRSKNVEMPVVLDIQVFVDRHL